MDNILKCRYTGTGTRPNDLRILKKDIPQQSQTNTTLRAVIAFPYIG